MDKETWILHIESEGVTRPSRGGDLQVWKAKVVEHLERLCAACLDRTKTKRAVTRARGLHQVK